MRGSDVVSIESGESELGGTLSQGVLRLHVEQLIAMQQMSEGIKRVGSTSGWSSRLAGSSSVTEFDAKPWSSPFDTVWDEKKNRINGIPGASIERRVHEKQLLGFDGRACRQLAIMHRPANLDVKVMFKRVVYDQSLRDLRDA